VRIGWYIDDVQGSLQAAQSQGKMLVIVFRADYCRWCALQLAHVLRCEAFNEFAGHAVFALVDPTQNDDARLLANNLGIDSYPAISVLGLDGTNVTERTRLIGFQPVSHLVPALKQALMLGNGLLYNGPIPKPATEISYGKPQPDCADDVDKRVSIPYLTPIYRP
jgi:hypothetical protein